MYTVGVSDVSSRLVCIHTFQQFLVVSQVAPDFNTDSADADGGGLGVALHVIVGATSIKAITVIPAIPPKERTCEPPQALVCPHILVQMFGSTAQDLGD